MTKILDPSESRLHGEVEVSNGKISLNGRSTTKMLRVKTNGPRSMNTGTRTRKPRRRKMMTKISDLSESLHHGEAVASNGKILLQNHGKSTTKMLKEKTSMPRSTRNWASTTRKSMAKMMMMKTFQSWVTLVTGSQKLENQLSKAPNGSETKLSMELLPLRRLSSVNENHFTG